MFVEDTTQGSTRPDVPPNMKLRHRKKTASSVATISLQSIVKAHRGANEKEDKAHYYQVGSSHGLPVWCLYCLFLLPAGDHGDGREYDASDGEALEAAQLLAKSGIATGAADYSAACDEGE